MIARLHVKKLLCVTLITLATTACGTPPAPIPIPTPTPTPTPTPIPTPTPTPVSLVPTGTITAGANENGTNANPLPTTVTITGTNLNGATVTFGESAGTDVMVNAAGTMLTVLAPDGLPGRRPVVVTTPNGKVNAGTYTFRQGDPRPYVRLLSASPINGPAAGGTVVTLTFDGSLTYSPAPQEAFTLPDVYFGAVQATGVAISSPGVLTAVSPTGSGFADITLKCPTSSCYTFSTTNSVPYQYLP
ncbi:IPT/TIG domain-containing protein [Deinococcus sp. SM5_A1]|uniref:IPT/TIG domain-containing protein n=1 Tax=Deinococcus sp. SM5_A1 TaxID=3379094 RepID=UPI00385B96D9